MIRDKDKLKKWIISKKLQNWPVTKICAHAQISRRMFYRWWNRYQKQGLEGLKENSKGRKSEYSISKRLEKQIIKLRKQHGWGPCKIEGQEEHGEEKVL